MNFLKLAVLLSIFSQKSRGQCGPDRDKPYPPNSQECPEGGGTDGGGDTPVMLTTRPQPAQRLGQIGETTVDDIESYRSFRVGELIYGPFEAGFTSQQDNILAGLGCSTGQGYVGEGIDTKTAESIVAADCGVELGQGEAYEPLLLDACGGHTEYHFHERLSCLYSHENDSGHSTQVGKESVYEEAEAKFLYGKWEDYSKSLLPKLDACGGHFGITPDSNCQVVYHYHVQDEAPFTFGCHGPDFGDGGEEKLVSLTKCRNDLYASECAAESEILITTQGEVPYIPWCPCYDGNGTNVLMSTQLDVFTEYGSEQVYKKDVFHTNAICAAQQASNLFDRVDGSTGVAIIQQTMVMMLAMSSAVSSLSDAELTGIMSNDPDVIPALVNAMMTAFELPPFNTDSIEIEMHTFSVATVKKDEPQEPRQFVTEYKVVTNNINDFNSVSSMIENFDAMVGLVLNEDLIVSFSSVENVGFKFEDVDPEDVDLDDGSENGGSRAIFDKAIYFLIAAIAVSTIE